MNRAKRRKKPPLTAKRVKKLISDRVKLSRKILNLEVRVNDITNEIASWRTAKSCK